MEWNGMNERESVGTTSDSLVARAAVPDTSRVSLYAVLSAECTGVSGVLGNFHLLNLLTERSTVSVEFSNQSLSHFQIAGPGPIHRTEGRQVLGKKYCT